MRPIAGGDGRFSTTLDSGSRSTAKNERIRRKPPFPVAPNESSCCVAAPNPMKAVRPPWQANRVHHCEKCRTNALSHRERVAAGRVRVASTTSACESPTLIRPAATFSRWEKDRPYRWNRTFRASPSRRQTKPSSRAKRSQSRARNEANPPRRTKPFVTRNEAIRGENEAICGAKRSQAVAPNEAKPSRRTKPNSPRRTKPMKVCNLVSNKELSQSVDRVEKRRGTADFGRKTTRRLPMAEPNSPRQTKPSPRRTKPFAARNEANPPRRTKPFAAPNEAKQSRQTKPFAARNEAKLAAPNEAKLAAPNESSCPSAHPTV